MAAFDIASPLGIDWCDTSKLKQMLCGNAREEILGEESRGQDQDGQAQAESDRHSSINSRTMMGMRIVRNITIVVALALVALASSACPEKGPAEKAGEKIDDAVDETKDAVKDATN